MLIPFEGDLQPDEDYERFTRAACTEVDLRGATLGITAGWESLRGVTIDSDQLVMLAPFLARHLGITVAD
jgi:hypothetical protein